MIIQMDMGSGEVEFATAPELRQQRPQPAAPAAMVEARLESVASVAKQDATHRPTVDDIDAFLARMHQISAASATNT